MNCLQVATHNVKWANDFIEKNGSDYLDNPTAGSSLYGGFLVSVGVMAAPAKTSYDLLKRSVTQLSPLDFAAGIASVLITFIACTLSPVVFIAASAFLLYNVYEANQANKSNSPASIAVESYL